MAQIIPDRIPSKASAGEKYLYNILSRLPDDFSVWYEPDINERYPDFIILSPNFGILIIEVKGWYPSSILKANSDYFEIKWKKDGIETNKREKSPLIQGRDYLLELLKQLERYPILTQKPGNYQGKLCFPYSVGAVMSNISYKQASEHDFYKQVLPIKKVVYRDELLDWNEGKISNEKIIKRFQEMLKFQFKFPKLTPEQIYTIKGLIYPELVIRQQKTDAGTALETLDYQQ